MLAADAAEELEKNAENAPGAQVDIRLIVEASEADWSLLRKFGCDREMAIALLGQARDGDPVDLCGLAGPSCDSADVLYEKQPVLMPLSLKSEDRVIIRNCGAYASRYSLIGFNGFLPLDVLVV